MKSMSSYNTFSNLYEYYSSVYEQDSESSRVGLFPGAFKPPHKGHYYTADQAAKNCDCLQIIPSLFERGEIGPETALNIWDIYLEYLRKDNPNTHIEVQPLPVQASPVRVVYQIVNCVNNNNDYKSKDQVIDGVRDIADSILQRYQDNITIVPVAGKGDAGRYDRLNGDSIYTGNIVSSINTLEVDRLTSASSVRASILRIASGEEDTSTLRQNLPDVLTPEDEEKVLNILLSK